jgi:hypothetical protein
MKEHMEKEIERYREETEMHHDRVRASNLELERAMTTFQ